MRSTLLALLAVCGLMTLGARQAEAQNFVEVFGGYSYVRGSVPVTSTIFCPELTCPVTTGTDHPSLNGWEAAGTINPGKWWGITADFSGHYGSVGSSSTHLQTYLFGPKLTYHGPVSPFVHVLLGVAHESVGTGTTSAGITVPMSGSAFALALGAGIDIKIVPLISFRPIQIDYLLTRFNSGTQSQPRISAGLVVHF
jgi:Outer membrane protein beta-barrel domain